MAAGRPAPQQGQFGPAATLYDRLIHDPGAPLDTRVKAANNLALIECQLGDPRAAFDRLSSARRRRRDGPAGVVAIVADSLGWVAVQLGRLSEGLRILESAAERHREAGLPLGEHYLEHCDALRTCVCCPRPSRWRSLHSASSRPTG